MNSLKEIREWRDEFGIRRIAYIDPGLGGTGVVLFVDGRPSASMCTPRKSGKDLANAVREITLDVVDFVEELGAEAMVIEWPEVWGSLKSTTSAKRGDLNKLSALVGSLIVQLNTAPWLVTPTEWKGQMDKEAVRARIFRALPDSGRLFMSEHVADACGMGLAVGGEL